MNQVKTSQATVLVVDDDPPIVRLLEAALADSGYRVCNAATGADARRMVEQAHPDLILLDLMLPDVDGLVLCATLKSLVGVPIVICSATSRKRDVVLALKLGADDFIPKPFDLNDLEARLETILRRSGRARPAAQVEGSPVRVGELVVDGSRRRVRLGGEPVQLTPTEYRLLVALASRPDEILSRDELAQLVWGYKDASIGRTIDVHIRRLRVKLTGGPVPAPAIVSVRGVGYKIASRALGGASSSAA